MFSSTVKLADLDDFLTPAQECVKPLLDAAKETATITKAKIAITADESLAMTDGIRPDLIKPRTRRKTTGPQKTTNTREAGTKSELPTEEKKGAQVSLYDCLSCAGCVTSAEAVLIEQQGSAEFVRAVQKKPLSVVSVSPQSRTSLAHFFNLSPATLMRKLSAFLRQLGVSYVVDMSSSDAITLLETRMEFAGRYAAHCADPSGRFLPLITSHCPGWVCYAEKVLEPEVLNHMSRVMSSQQIQGRLVKTLLLRQHNAKACLWKHRQLFSAAFVCSPLNRIGRPSYTLGSDQARSRSTSATSPPQSQLEEQEEEKEVKVERDDLSSHVNFVSTEVVAVETEHSIDDDVRHVTQTEEYRTSLLVGRRVVLSPADLYHACIMPCYDKKLEATRSEFHLGADDTRKEDITDEAIQIPEVDIVLATSEICTLLDEYNINIHDLPDADVDDLFLDFPFVPLNTSGFGAVAEHTHPSCLTIPSAANFGSGGFLADVVRFTASDLINISLPSDLKLVSTRNADYREISLEPAPSMPPLRFVMAYGFRNIQNIVRRLKVQSQGNEEDRLRRADNVDPPLAFVEIMACPGGCLNGGGQILSSLPREDRNISEVGQEDSRKRRRRLDALEELLHQSGLGGADVVPPESHPLVADIYKFMSESNSRPFYTSFRCLRQLQTEQGLLVPSSLKW